MRTKGFTLIEILIAVILVGLGVAGLVGANAAFSQSNGAGVELSTAEFLIEQIREMTTMTDFDLLHNFDEIVYSPPKDARGNDLSGFDSYSQTITVENVSGSNFENVVTDFSSDFVRVSVEVRKNSRLICSTSWLRADD